MGDQVQNRYRQAIGDALPGLRRQAGLVDSVFDTVQSALRGGAWTSTVADAFAAECESQERAAEQDGDDAVDTASSRYRREPALVDETDPRARW